MKKEKINELAVECVENFSESKLNNLICNIRSYVKNISYKYFNDYDNVEDITQDCLLKIFNSFFKFQPTKGSFTTWVYTLCVNECLDEIRRQKKFKNKISLEKCNEVNEYVSNNIEEYIYNKENSDVLLHALSLVSENRRKFIIDRYINQLSYIEISDKYSLRINRVGVEIGRAKLELRNNLPDNYSICA